MAEQPTNPKSNACTRLTVPVAVEALLVGRNGLHNADGKPTQFADVSPNYSLIATQWFTLGDKLMPPPFQTRPSPAAGVHLHWALPDGLTHGIQGLATATASIDEAGAVDKVKLTSGGYGYKEPPQVRFDGSGTGAVAETTLNEDGVVDGIRLVSGGAGYVDAPLVAIQSSSDIRYPPTPDRWFVLRMHSDAKARKISLRGWVMESNALTAPSEQQSIRRRIPGDWDRLVGGALSRDLLNALTEQGFAISSNAQLFSGEQDEHWYLIDGVRVLRLHRDTDGLVASEDKSITWPTLDDSNTPFMFLGADYDYGSGPPKVTQYLKTITAVGPGDPQFAAFYPNSKSVYGFHDPLVDVQDAAQLTYLVSGWYSDPAENPLAGFDQPDQWLARMEQLGWSAASSSSTSESNKAPVPPPTDVLCHGMVYGVDWKGAGASYASGVPAGQPELAIGNASIEALSALVASKLPGEQGIEEILEAFQFSLLDKLQDDDSSVELDLALHANQFRSAPGGTVWEVRSQNDSKADPKELDPTKFNPTVGQLLTDLNRLQFEFEQSTHNLHCVQWQTYAVWYLKILKDLSPYGSPEQFRVPGGLPDFAALASSIMDNEYQLPNALPETPASIEGSQGITKQQIIELLGKFAKQIGDAEGQLQKTKTQLEAKQQELEKTLADKMPDYNIVPAGRPRFWGGNDPVLLFSGPGLQRSFKHGADGQLEEDQKLRCRLPGDTITGLSVEPPGHPLQTVTQTQLQSFYGQFPPGNPLPAAVIPLMVETLLLDCTAAELIALAAFQLAGVDHPNPAELTNLTKSVRKIQTMPWNAAVHVRLAKRSRGPNSQQLAEAAGLVGCIPSKIAVDPWRQPWNPLLLEWKVQFYPSYEKPSDIGFCKPTDQTCNQKWIFGETDFNWNTKFPPQPSGGGGPIYDSRTILSPSPSFNLKSRVEQYLEENPDSKFEAQLKKILNVIGDLNLLSQGMGGFDESLLMRIQALQLPVIDLFDPDVGKEVAKAIGDQNQVAPRPECDYKPIRAGHFKVIEAWIVDGFGQIQPVVGQGVEYNPVLARSLKTAGAEYKTLAQLPPRLAQPSRLNFDWIMADDDNRRTNSDPSTSPVCGWLIPNYFDNSVMVYNSDGAPLGSLQLLAGRIGPEGSAVRWTQTPGSDTPLGAPPEIDNPHLRGLVDRLLQFGAEGKPAVQQFLKGLYRALSLVNPVGSAAQDGNLAVLIGRPLALVRASLKLELQGLPQADQSWQALQKLYETGTWETQDFPQVPFWVRLGDERRIRDGAIGYFLGDDYSKFFATLVTSPDPEPPDSDYVKYGQMLQLTADPTAPPQYISMLVDPRAPVHATSDILPTKRVDLPPYHIQEALASMDVTFRIGPVLNDAEKLSMPLPADIHGKWSWVFHPDVTTWREEEKIAKEDAIAQLPAGPRQINEGWLKLSDALKK